MTGTVPTPSGPPTSASQPGAEGGPNPDSDGAIAFERSLRAAPQPLFLHRATYRRRRVMDAARLLPALGLALMLLPVLWVDTHSTAMGAVYLFLAWAALIAVSAILARRLREPLPNAQEAQTDWDDESG